MKEREDQSRAYVGSTFESAGGALWTVEEGVLVREDPDGVKASRPYGHASVVVAAIWGGRPIIGALLRQWVRRRYPDSVAKVSAF